MIKSIIVANHIHIYNIQQLSNFQKMNDFGFIESCGWLKPFIIQLKEQYVKSSDSDNNIIIDDNKINDTGLDNKSVNVTTDDVTTFITTKKHDTLPEDEIFTDSTLTFQDATDFAVQNLDTIFKENCLTVFQDHYSWTECIEMDNRYKHIRCRVSRGFGNRHVPITKKFNPIFHDEQYSEKVLLAKNSYRYLYYRNEIETILKTPSSDYTRFSVDTDTNILNRFFMMNLRNIQKNGRRKIGPFEQILETYNSKVQIM